MLYTILYCLNDDRWGAMISPKELLPVLEAQVVPYLLCVGKDDEVVVRGLSVIVK